MRKSLLILIVIFLSTQILAEDQEVNKTNKKLQILQAKLQEYQSKSKNLEQKLAEMESKIDQLNLKKGDEAVKKSESKEEKIERFQFGSYGRIGVASSFDNSSGYQTSIVTHGSRLEFGPYQELHFKYNFTDPNNDNKDTKVRLIYTQAFAENYFHYDAKFDMKTAIRQFYLDVDNLLIKGLNLWVGSRMYRGDDIYLLDYWPLDNLNTMGAGFVYYFNKDKPYEGQHIKFHVGVNRLDQGGEAGSFQYAYYPVTVKGSIWSENVLLLDRQRYITSLLYYLPLPSSKMNLKFYGEYHYLNEGSYKKELTEYEWPTEMGFVAGMQFTYYGFGNDNSFAHLFLRYAKDLAAYGEMGIPYGVNIDKDSAGAQDIVAGLAANWENSKMGLMVGGYYRMFNDADDNEYDIDDFQEEILDIRYQYYFTDQFHIATEFSFEALKPAGISNETYTETTPMLFKWGLMPTFSPNGKGNYKQPQIRLIYTMTYMNDDARLLFPEQDKRRESNTHHYIGITAEWWFNNL